MIAADDVKLIELKEFIGSIKEKAHWRSYLIAVLHKAQGLYGYLSTEVMDVIAKEMEIPTSQIWGAATFYHYFNLKAPGKHTVSVCLGTACYVKGAGDVMDSVKKHLNVEVGDTTEDGMFSLQPARCLGACGLAPVMMVDDKIYGDLTAKKAVQIIENYRKKATK